MFGSGPNRRRPNGWMFGVYLQCYFVTIATILGTGILGLPVTLTYAGLYPFLVSFGVGFFMQGLVVYFMTDLLQRAYAVQLEAVTECGRGEHLPLYSIIDEEESLEEEEINEKEIQDSVPDLAGHVILPAEDAIKPPNLHMLGEYFLLCGIRQFFDVSILLLFIAILISYALAGSEAYAEIIGISHFYVIPVFVGVLTVSIVFALKLIQPVVSVLTFLKGTVLLGTVVVTFLLGTKIHNSISNDFSAVGDPFLMGTVALGGIFQTMPMLYEKIQPVPNQVINYRRSVLLGIITCTGLNILWCWAVLDIVPQTSECPAGVDTGHSLNTSAIKEIYAQNAISCHSNISLQHSNENGEISTVPLTMIIHDHYPSYMWIAVLVEVFIVISTTVSYLTIGAALHHTSGIQCPSGDPCLSYMWIAVLVEVFIVISTTVSYLTIGAALHHTKTLSLWSSGIQCPSGDPCPSYMWIAVLVEVFIVISTTVSYLTIGAALHHTISGWVDSLWSQDKFAVYKARFQARSKRLCEWCNTKCVCGSFLSLLAFSVVFCIAMANPKGFVQILEKFASLSLNIQSGFFLFLMMHKATKRNCFGNLQIPLPLPGWVYYLQYLLPLYFGFAVGFDVYVMIRDIVNVTRV
ncbi:uncharacterized protein LOC135479301 [Liolophura sinensis]|uniref:uncharacterized protein LOC135479301 n=1 Tax=Liolophura sinensis TaxID=3198878 RepID=UPI0031586E3B